MPHAVAANENVQLICSSDGSFGVTFGVRYGDIPRSVRERARLRRDFGMRRLKCSMGDLGVKGQSKREMLTSCCMYQY